MVGAHLEVSCPQRRAGDIGVRQPIVEERHEAEQEYHAAEERVLAPAPPADELLLPRIRHSLALEVVRMHVWAFARSNPGF